MPERLTFADAAGRAWEVYREHTRFLLLAALLVLVPIALVDAAGEHLHADSDDLSELEIAGVLVAVLVSATTSTLGEQFYTGVVLAAVAQTMTGKPRPGLGRILRTLPYASLIAIDLLFTVGLAIGLTLLVVPGVIFFARYALSAPLLRIEVEGVRDAFRHSRELSRGNARVILLLLGSLYLLSGTLTNYLQSDAGAAVGDTFLADWLIAAAVSCLVTPVWAVATGVVAWRLLHLKRGGPATSGYPSRA